MELDEGPPDHAKSTFSPGKISLLFPSMALNLCTYNALKQSLQKASPARITTTGRPSLHFTHF